MHWSLIQRLWPGSIASANPAGSRLNRKNQYIPVHTSMYSFTDSCTAMYLHVPPYTVPCTVMYHLVPPWTTLNHDRTGQYIPDHPATYGPRNFLCQYILVRTKMRFLMPPCRLNHTYWAEYKLPCTAIYQVYRIPDVIERVNLLLRLS